MHIGELSRRSGERARISETIEQLAASRSMLDEVIAAAPAQIAEMARIAGRPSRPDTARGRSTSYSWHEVERSFTA